MARRCAFLVGVAAVLGAGGSRYQRREAPEKHIGGVPILNYERAYQGQSLLEGQELEENWVVVTKGASNAQISALCAISTCELVGHPEEGGVPFFEIRGTEKDLHKIVEQGAGLLDFIEPDGIADIDASADEAPEAATWGLDRIGADSRSSTGLGVHMYIFDTGVRTTHREFSGRAVATLDCTSGSPVVCSGSTDCASDNNGHGTHVAGSAAGDSFGVAPGATVHGVKALSDRGPGEFSWSMGGIDWVSTQGQKPGVINLSLGGRMVQHSFETTISAAIARGLVVLVAAGNADADACGFTPAFSPSAITVGATQPDDARWFRSNYGSCVDFWAPGQHTPSAWYRSDTDTATHSGSSMACPHVAGGAALIHEENPGYGHSQVWHKLQMDAEIGVIKNLGADDQNKLLHVGR